MAKPGSVTAKEEREARRKARRQNAQQAENKVREQTRTAPGPRPKGKVREWTDALLFAVVAAIIIRAFFFEAFRIPTPSMERNLLVGDFLLVSKLHYGPRTPLTAGIPFTDIYLRNYEFPYFRLPGFTSMSHGDVVVFNYPKETEPIDRKTHYIKRVFGMPGDTLRIENKMVMTNDTEWPLREGMQHQWMVHKEEGPILPYARLRELGIRQHEIHVTDDANVLIIETTAEAIGEIESWPYIELVEPRIEANVARYREDIFPPNSGFTPDNYGPLLVPTSGQTIELTEENWAAYEEIISRFEGRGVRTLPQGGFEIDGVQVESYTFDQNYYFMIGDNRDNSLDSRFWGFVPQDHIVGRAVMTYFSWDAESNLPRFNRMFRFIR